MKKMRFFSKWCYMIPAVVLMLLFYIWPLIMTIYYSFTNLALTGSAAANFKNVGLLNFQNMLADRAFTMSIVRTLVFLIGSIVGQTAIGFILAYYMRTANKRIRKTVGIVILAAWIMPELVASVCTYTLFTVNGSINAVLEFFHMEKISWLIKHPMFSVVVSNIWRGSAFSMLVYQAALDSIPGDVEEAAMIDGVNRWQNLIHIILPQIKGTFLTNTLMITLKTLGCFGLIFAMTGGGPNYATSTLSIFTYTRAFKNGKLGYACACSLILLLIGACVSVIYIHSSRKDEQA